MLFCHWHKSCTFFSIENPFVTIYVFFFFFFFFFCYQPFLCIFSYFLRLIHIYLLIPKTIYWCLFGQISISWYQKLRYTEFQGMLSTSTVINKTDKRLKKIRKRCSCRGSTKFHILTSTFYCSCKWSKIFCSIQYTKKLYRPQ